MTDVLERLHHVDPGVGIEAVVGWATAHDIEAVPAVEGTNRVPMKIFQPHWKVEAVRDPQTMGEDGGAGSAPLILRKQIELAEAHVVRQHLEGHGSEPQSGGSPDLEEGFLSEPACVEIALECFIPSPAPDDMRSHRSSFGLEGEVDILPAVAKPGEGEIGRKGRQPHVTSITAQGQHSI